MERHFVYIILNPEGIYYKGYTTNLDNRLNQHNSGIGKYTSGKGPWVLVYSFEFTTKREALVEEKRLKKLNARSLEKLISFN